MQKKVAVALLAAVCTLGPLVRAKDRYQQVAPVHLGHNGEKWAQKTLKKLSLEEKVGQLFMIWVRLQFFNVQNPDFLQLGDSIKKYHVGGFCMSVPVDGPFLLRNEPLEAADLLNRLQIESKLPLLIS